MSTTFQPQDLEQFARKGADVYASTLVAGLGDVTQAGGEGYFTGYTDACEVLWPELGKAINEGISLSVGFGKWIGENGHIRMTDGKWETFDNQPLADDDGKLYMAYLDWLHNQTPA